MSISTYYPSMSWRNNSTNPNDLSGVASFKIQSVIRGHIPHEVQIPLSSFDKAHELFSLLNNAVDLGRHSMKQQYCASLKVVLDELEK